MDERGGLKLLSGKKALYAEDEDGIRKNITEILGHFFYSVDSVKDGKELVERFTVSNYDVLIVDIMMPGLDGLDALKKIREIDRKIPVIVLTAHSEQQYLWRAIELKISKYITKPFSRAQLVEALEYVADELSLTNERIYLTESRFYDTSQQIIFSEGETLRLTKSESRLLEFFLEKSDQIVTYDEIYDRMWQFEPPSKEAIKSLVKELRRKIGKNIIRNVYGRGYIFEIKKG